MSNTKDPAFWIERIADFQAMGDRERNVLAAICDVGTYKPGSPIVQQNSRPPVVPLLVEGDVEGVYVTPNRQRVTIIKLGPPDLVGFLWFLDPAMRSPLGFEATTPSICLNIRVMDLENLYNSGNALSFPILGMLYRRAASQFRAYNDRFKQLYERPDETYMTLVKLLQEGG